MKVNRAVLPVEQVARLVQVQLENGGVAQLNVTGYSMMPMVHHRRDRVQLATITGKEKIGDVIFYRRENGKYILHRVVDKTKDGFICCGDNQAEKELVLPQQLLAVMTGFTRNGKTYSVTHPAYRLYTGLWVGLFCLRPAYIALRRRFGRWKHKRNMEV